MHTQEFQAVVPLVGPDGLRVMGFDPQLSGDYSDDLVDDLEDFLESEKGSNAINYGLLGDTVSFMQAHFAFPPTTALAGFEAELAKADPLLRKAAEAPAAARRREAAFWQQCLRSLGALARDYATNHTSTKTAADWVAANSNPRDAQMADNLLWYLRQHPAEKVICWGALPHFANRVDVLDSDELRSYQPMGRAVKAALGADQVYILGTLAGGGTHGSPGTAGVPVPPPAAGTLEARLLALDAPYAFVSLKHDAAGRQLTTYAFDYQPLAGPWSEVVDGFVFLRSVAPSHLVRADSSAAPVAAADTAHTVVASQLPGSLNPAPGLGGTTVRQVVTRPDVSGVRLVRGVVLDQRSRAPVPYASVMRPGRGQGAVADAQGRFALPLPGPTPLQVSGLGYSLATVQSPRGNEELTVLLATAPYALDELRVASVPPDPVTILKNVIKNIPVNYAPPGYATEVYGYQRRTNLDTLRYEAETASRVWAPVYHQRSGKGFLLPADESVRQLEQQHVLTKKGTNPGPSQLANGLVGPASSLADPVQTSPLFVARNLRKFILKLDSVRQQGTETLYVLSFAAQPASRRSADPYLAGEYQGQLVVRQRDYAVLHYQALWRLDTAANGAARQHQPKSSPASQPNALVMTANRTTLVVDYAKNTDGRYYARHSLGQSLSAGRSLKTQQPFYYQIISEQFSKTLLAAGPAPVAPKQSKQTPPSAPPDVPYRPEFWSGYQRPGGPLASPAPQR